MTVTAPKAKSFPTVETGNYDATVHEVETQDYNETPFSLNPAYAPRYGWRFLFKWALDGKLDDEGEPILIYQYVWLETGANPRKSGARAGKLPQLTEITRAFGEPDIQPQQEVDEQAWVGKGARLTILEEVKPDGNVRNNINAVLPRKASGARPPVAATNPTPSPEGRGDDQLPATPKMLAELTSLQWELRGISGEEYEILEPLTRAEARAHHAALKSMVDRIADVLF